MLCCKPTGTGVAFAFFLVAALLFPVFISPTPAVAGTTWDGGGGDNLWSTAANWSPDGVPANNGTSSLAFAGTTRLTPDMDANWSINSLTFNSGAGAFTLGSTGAFTLTIQGGGITNSSTNTETINNAIILGTAQTWSATSGALSLGGNINKAGFLLTIGGGFNTTASGVISGSGGLTKSGAGTLTLTGTNTFIGNTTINGGTVSISKQSNLGASGNSIYFNGGTLQVTGSFFASSAKTFFMDTGGGTVDVATGITLSNVVLNGNPDGLGTFNKNGAGTVVISNAINFNFGGAVNVNAGVLHLDNAQSLGSPAALNVYNAVLETSVGLTGYIDLYDGSTLRSTTGMAHTAFIWAHPGATATIFQAGAAGSDVRFASQLNFNTVNNTTATSTIVFDAANPGAIASVANTNMNYAGWVTVKGGILRLEVTGAFPTAVAFTASGGVLALSVASGSLANTVALTGGTLGAAANPATYAGAVSVSANSTVQAADATATATSRNITISSILSGASSGVTLTKTGGGTLTLSGTASNTFAGTLQVSTGTVALSKTAALDAVAGGLIIGDGIGGANADIVQLTNANQIKDTSAVQINSSGKLDLNGKSETIGSLSDGSSGGGNVTSGAAGAITLTTGANNTSTLFSGVLQNGSGTLALTKSGTGTWTLSGPNTFTGATTISAGALNIQNNTGLGTTAGGVSVTSGAALELQGTITVGAETLTLNGTGISSGGALRNISGNNSYAGAITINSTTRINSDSGTLTIDVASGNAITGSNDNLQIGGAGNVTINDAIATGSGTLTKDGAGTVVLSGANTFTGSTTVSGGTLTLSAGGTGALGSTASVTVNSGGTLMLGASNQINNTAPMTLAGGTFGKGNFSEGSASGPGVGALTLTASGSQIDFGSGTVGVLTFASFTPGSFTLAIANWTGTAGTVGNGTTDRLIFDVSQSANLGSFAFDGYAPGAMEFNLGNGYYEITPVTAVPEPSTYLAAALALATIGFHQARRLRGRSKRA